MADGGRPGEPSGPLRRPASAGELFRVFTGMALQGFGGVLPVSQRELVERQRWLSRDDFVEMLALAQILPGPNIVNLSLMVGDRFLGLRGAMAAMAGMLVVPLALVLLLAALYGQWRSYEPVAGALRGMGVVAAGLVVSTAVKLGLTLPRNLLGLPLCLLFGALAAAAVGALRWPLVWVVLVLGTAAGGAAWWRIRR